MANLAHHYDKAVSHVKRLTGQVTKHKETIGAVVMSAAHQVEASAAGAAAALADHYLTSIDSASNASGTWEVVGIPGVLGAGVLLGGIALIGGQDGWASHATAFASGLEACGTYALVRAALAAKGGSKNSGSLSS